MVRYHQMGVLALLYLEYAYSDIAQLPYIMKALSLLILGHWFRTLKLRSMSQVNLTLVSDL